jgi:plastocyanin
MLVKINKATKPLLLISFLITIGITGCNKNDVVTNPNNNTGGGTPSTSEVLIQNMAFAPSSLTVAVGTTVKWTNKDSMAHTVTSGTSSTPNGIFNSGSINNNGTFSYTFNTQGTFPYFCNIHHSMVASIIVQ